MIILKKRSVQTSAPAPTLSAERLREVLDYDPKTGVFTWAKKTGTKVVVGSVAGCVKRGYRYIRIDGVAYLAHRLAFLHVLGDWPEEDVDHINGDPSDNRATNLRPATPAQNHANSRLRTGKTLPKGVKAAAYGRFHARIIHGGVETHLGAFGSVEDAHAAYMAAAVKYHGEFARAG